MGGFRNFLLRGNLVDLAVAVIIGTAFAAVVAAFTAWSDRRAPRRPGHLQGSELGDGAFFLNALISFAILATVVYFFVVLPYTRARERFFPSPAPGTPEDVELLRQIRDLLATQAGAGHTTDSTGSGATPPQP